MESKLLWMPGVSHRLELPRNFIECFIPSDSFPLSLTAFAYTFQWIKQTLWMIEVIQGSLPTCTQITTTIGVIGIAFHLQQTTIFDIANHPTHGATQLAHSGDLHRPVILRAIRPISLRQRPRQITDTGHLSKRTELIRFRLEFSPFFDIDSLPRRVHDWTGIRRTLITGGRCLFGPSLYVATGEHAACDRRQSKIQKTATLTQTRLRVLILTH